MRLYFACLLLLSAMGTLAAAETRAASGLTILPAPDPERDGQTMAARLRAAVPEQDSEFTGRLFITARDGQFREVPIVSRLMVGRTNWQVTYRTVSDGKRPEEVLTITKSTNAPGLYEFFTGTNTVRRVLGADELTQPFAGSDFWAMDLGLEFFQWPKQKKIKNEVRRSRSCNVLESINPTPVAGGYAKVLTWIDVDTDGILLAEAYGADGKLIKDFAIGALRKVNGQHQLESMKIRSRKTGQDTELKFDL